jgi:23S rRNA pseudouridine1911/1915/1917 synthase
MPLDILFEDEHVLVLNKPAGLTAHPGAGINTGTLVNGLLAHTKGALSFKGGAERPGIVHRLDKETSGVMVVAKTDVAYDSLTAQFADHGLTGPLERAYQALIWGRPYHLHGQIDAPIGRSSKSRTKMAVVKEGEGRHAITNYEVVETLDLGKGLSVSEVVCRLETGRTHQIRVHFAHLKCPVLGDPVYGPGFITKSLGLAPHQKAAFDALGRQALHAFSLSFEHPETGEEMNFETDAPEDYQALYDALKS